MAADCTIGRFVSRVSLTEGVLFILKKVVNHK